MAVKPSDFKSDVYTNSTTLAIQLLLRQAANIHPLLVRQIASANVEKKDFTKTTVNALFPVPKRSR